MVRWQPNARGRLEEAALELYAERGFDRTTVAEIAERAGLTERTFFRHFGDKREVLFGGEDALIDVLVTPVVAAHPSESPMSAVGAGLIAVGRFFEDRHARARQRQAVIAATPALQERELMKLVSLVTALTEALGRRGVAASTARLAAEFGIAVFKVAFERWADGDDGGSWEVIVSELLDELSALTTTPRR